MARLVVIRGKTIDTTKPYTIAAGALVTAILAGVCLGLGCNKECRSNDDYCQYWKQVYIVCGSLFATSAGLSMISAVALHFTIKRVIKADELRQTEERLAASPDYPPPPYVPATPTQYSTPHSTPTELSSPLPPPAYEDLPKIGFATDSQPYPPEIAQSPQDSHL